MNLEIAIAGSGAVSSAGWGVRPLMEAMRFAKALPSEEVRRAGVRRPRWVRRVPPPPPGLSFLKEPRMRRVSPISRFAVAAALEALGEAEAARVKSGETRLGIVFTLLNGCVNYSQRFFAEVERDPSLASPILFPETVYDAPASHLAALLGSKGPCYTLVGDSGQFLPAARLAAEWLWDDEADACLVVGAEEIDWLSGEAAEMFGRGVVVSEGAGAWLLHENAGPVSASLAGPVSFLQDRSRDRAAERWERPSTDVLLVDGSRGARQLDRAEAKVWSDWPGARLSPAQVLGDSLGAALALQCVVAVESIASGQADRAFVSHVGGNQQAVTASLSRRL